MRQLIDEYKNKYFGEDVPVDVKNFNGIHFISILGILASMVLILFFFPTTKSFLAAFATAVFALFTLYEGNRTTNYLPCAIVMSCVINFVFFPTIYFEYGKVSTCIQIYFLFGLIYNVMVMPRVYALVISAVDIVAYVFISIVGTRVFVKEPLVASSFNEYLAVLVGIVLTSLVCGLAIRYRIYLHNQEQLKLEKIHKEAMETYVAKDIFLINMSHEIRTPMNAIVGTVDLLLDQDVSDYVRECAYNILNSSNALLSLTTEIMDLSKTTSDGISLVDSKIDIKELLVELINMMAVRLMDSKVKLHVNISEELPAQLYGDGQKLKQVLINILNNSVKYTEEGSILFSISTEMLSDNDINLRISVKDTGRGISEELLPEIFNPNRNSVDSENNEIGGNIGLGLPISKEILDKMGGKIDVITAVGVGSEFIVTVPMQSDSKEKIVNIEAANRFNALIFMSDSEEISELSEIFTKLNVNYHVVSDSREFEHNLRKFTYNHVFVSSDYYQSNLKIVEDNLAFGKLVVVSDVNESISISKFGFIMTRPIHLLNVSSVLLNLDSSYSREVIKKGGFECPESTILVVDDNLTNLKVASGLLKKYNANVLTALSGRECLNILAKEHVDLLFLDYMMPEMNGIDTLNEIRSKNIPRLNNMPAVALTANVVSGAREMFIEAGFNEYISKPIDADKIEKTLRNLLPKEQLLNKIS